VVLFNLGGPDRPEAVEPFLRNLFRDPAILRVPGFVREPLAWLIARRRAPIAQEIYHHLGGRSPLLANTVAQAAALQQELGDLGEVRVFVAMRYWHPLSQETVAEVQAFAPDRLVLLPLYPQRSTATTDSSLEDWRQTSGRMGLSVPTATVGPYPTEPGLVEALAAGIRTAWVEAGAFGRPRLLFTAHGLPKRVVAAGDPYPEQCAATVAAVVERLAMPQLDWVMCYQSRVGPLEWIGPATEDELRRAGHDGVPVVVVPYSFVSEHSETLVELDIEYRKLAEDVGVPDYRRVAAVGTADAFIKGLGTLVRTALQ
jgi:ferrochelatase